MKKHISLKDLATELNLSISTVSRALRDSYDISPTVKKQVADLARKRGYSPNLMAQALINKSSNLIGIVVPDLVTHFYSSIINGIESVTRPKSYYTLITSSHESYENEIEAIDNMLGIRAGGLIVCLSQQTNDYAHLYKLREMEVPTVYVDRVPPGDDLWSVVADDAYACCRLTRHLIETGARRIAFVGGPAYLNITRDRKEGYLLAMSENGLRTEDSLVIETPLGEYDGVHLFDRIAALDPLPDAVVCMNDTILYSLVPEIRRRNRQEMNRIRIVGFTDELYSRLLLPGQISMVHPAFEMGRMAAEKLLKIIRGTPPARNREICPCHLDPGETPLPEYPTPCNGKTVQS